MKFLFLSFLTTAVFGNGYFKSASGNLHLSVTQRENIQINFGDVKNCQESSAKTYVLKKCDTESSVNYSGANREINKVMIEEVTIKDPYDRFTFTAPYTEKVGEQQIEGRIEIKLIRYLRSPKVFTGSLQVFPSGVRSEVVAVSN